MSTKTRDQEAETRYISQTRTEIEARTGPKTNGTFPPTVDNPPIKRADGSYRPLDTDLIEKMIKNPVEEYEYYIPPCEQELDFWKEFGDKWPWWNTRCVEYARLGDGVKVSLICG